MEVQRYCTIAPIAIPQRDSSSTIYDSKGKDFFQLADAMQILRKIQLHKEVSS